LNANFVKYKSFLFNSFLLLLPGALTSLGIILFASGRITSIPNEVVAVIILILQMQVFGITVAKYGLDINGFALLSAKENHSLELRPIFLQRVIPLAFLFGCGVAYFYGILIGLVIMINSILESYSISVITEMNVNKDFKKSAIINLIGYPLFFLCFFVYSIFMENISIESAIIILLGISIVKALFALQARKKYNQTISPNMSFQVSLQQILNYLLFKSDQIIIATLVIKFHWFSFTGNDQNWFIYLSKFPEVISGVLVGLSALYLNSFAKQINEAGIFYWYKRNLKIIIASMLVLISLAFIHFAYGVYKQPTAAFLYIPFLLHCLFIVPTNLFTYLQLQNQNLPVLNKNYAIALSIGLIILIITWLLQHPLLLILMVPTQLIVFNALFCKAKKI
jgi:hypothetical protein